jgi:methylglutaconyl-CoA hydratase
MSAAYVSLQLLPLREDRPDQLAVMTLDRPDTFNAFNHNMIGQITECARKLRTETNVRALVLRGAGKHFCAGADLEWMQASATLSYDENVLDAKRLQEMFESIDQLDVPIICLAHGSAFGGAVGLIALADIVLASADARFCLSEVKLGLLPAVILPYVARRMSAGSFRRYSLTARVFGVEAAVDAGLVDRVVPAEQLQSALNEELNLLLAGSPEAQAQLKLLYRQARADQFRQSALTAESIAKARTSFYGQSGLRAFFAKTDAPWKLSVAQDWKLP